MIDQMVVRRVQAEVSLLELAREQGLDLRRRGADWWACCPFHAERTGSFKISERRNRFKCFGCGAAGDVIAFFLATGQRDARRAFPEAVRQLAARGAIACHEEPGAAPRRAGRGRRTREEIEAARAQRRALELARRAHLSREAILARWAWPVEELRSEAPGSLAAATPEAQARALLRLFPGEDRVWCGELRHSIPREEVEDAAASWREEVGRHFRSAGEWIAGAEVPGSRICAAVFPPGAVYSRSQEGALGARFLVVEHDHLPLAAQGALLRWLREQAGLRLRAVVFTGNKSLHGWFDYPASPAGAAWLKAVLCGVPVEAQGRRGREGGLGFDPAIWNPVQPWRLPGWTHEKTGRLAELWWFEGGAR